MDLTKPSGNPGDKPFGKKTHIHPRASRQTQHKLMLENRSAVILANRGYKVEQNPAPVSGKEPDYRIEGRVFDCYAPSSSNPDRIRNSVSRKVKEEQSDRIILNLEDSSVSPEELLKVLERRSIEELKEIIVIKEDKIMPFFPKSGSEEL